MPDPRIEAALRDATDTEDLAIGPKALDAVAEGFGRTFEGRPARVVADAPTRAVAGGGALVFSGRPSEERPAVVVSDATTWRVAGERVQRALEAAGRPTEAPYRFPPDTFVQAEYGNVERLREALATHQAVPVAVGSGSLNDLVKRAAHEVGRRYLSVATAASMDGYTAFGAAITRQGYKQTLTCPAPRALVADLDVLAGARADMTPSGSADLLGKATAGADWLVADALSVEPVDPAVWELVQGPLPEAIGGPAGLAGGDRGGRGG